MEALLDILKVAGLVIAGVIGLVGFYSPDTWEEYDLPGKDPKKGKRLTRWGRRSRNLLICSALIGLCAQIVETTRSHQKEAAEAKSKQEEQKRIAKEKQEDRERFAREKEEDRKEFDRKLREERERYEAFTSEYFLLKNDLERQKMQAIEVGRTAKVDLKITVPLEPLPSSPKIDTAFEHAMESIPKAAKEVAALRNKEALERLPLENRARDIEEATHAQMIHVVDFYRNALTLAHKRGLITIKDLGSAPMLPDQIVFSTKATNNPYGSFAEHIAQTVEFSHGDRWHAYLVIGLVDSLEHTNQNWYPKLRYKDLFDTVGTIWFDPGIGDLRYASNRGRGTATSRVDIVTSIIADLTFSRTNAFKP